MKRWLSVLLTLCLCVVVMLALCVSASAKNECRLYDMTLKTESGEVLDQIKNGHFWVTVSAKKTGKLNATILLATYDSAGRYLGLYTMRASIPTGTVYELGALVDNTDGKIVTMKAFAVDSLSGGRPLGDSIEYGKRSYTIETGEMGRPVLCWRDGTTEPATPIQSYDDGVSGSDLWSESGMSADQKLALYVNGRYEGMIRLGDMIAYGLPGRLTEVYSDRIVMIDTFLARVRAVRKAEFSTDGKLLFPAQIALNVWDDAVTHDAEDSTAVSVFSLSNGSENYPYDVGDYVLVWGHTAENNSVESSGKLTAVTQILGCPEEFTGAQTIIWINTNQRTIDGKDYFASYKYRLDEASTNANKYTWFLDPYGYLIGSVQKEPVYNYGVITKLFYAGTVESGAGIGSGKYVATVKYMDGTENTVEVASVKAGGANYAPVYGNAYDLTMKFVKAAAADTKGELYISGDYATNNKLDQVDADTPLVAGTTFKYDVIDGHLFRMSVNAAGKTVFERVEDQLADTAAQKVYVTNKGGYIYNYTKNLKVDVNTKFLYVTPLKNGVFNWAGTYEYKTADGIANIPTFKSVKRLDYVLGSDNVADYVYIIGETADSVVKEFVFGNTVAYKTVLKDDGVDYYEVELPTKTEGGETATVKTAGTDKGLALMKVLTDVKNSGKLFYIKYVNGLAVEVTEIGVEGVKNASGSFTAGSVRYDGDRNTDGTPKGTIIGTWTSEDGKQFAVKLNGAKVAGEIIETVETGVTTRRYYKADGTVVYGELKDGTTDSIVYVVYTEKAMYGAMIADKIYVTSKEVDSTTN